MAARTRTAATAAYCARHFSCTELYGAVAPGLEDAQTGGCSLAGGRPADERKGIPGMTGLMDDASYSFTIWFAGAAEPSFMAYLILSCSGLRLYIAAYAEERHCPLFTALALHMGEDISSLPASAWTLAFLCRLLRPHYYLSLPVLALCEAGLLPGHDGVGAGAGGGLPSPGAHRCLLALLKASPRAVAACR